MVHQPYQLTFNCKTNSKHTQVSVTIWLSILTSKWCPYQPTATDSNDDRNKRAPDKSSDHFIQVRKYAADIAKAQFQFPMSETSTALTPAPTTPGSSVASPKADVGDLKPELIAHLVSSVWNVGTRFCFRCTQYFISYENWKIPCSNISRRQELRRANSARS